MKLKREFIKTDKLKMPGFKCQNKFYASVSVMQIKPNYFESIIRVHIMI